MIESDHDEPRAELAAPSSREAVGHCLTWWRRKPADRYDAATVRMMRITLNAVDMPGEERWSAAAAGDAAAAIGVAYRTKDHACWPFDPAMTALALAASVGDAAACVMLATVLRGIPGAGKSEARIATSWLARAFASHRPDRCTQTGGAS